MAAIKRRQPDRYMTEHILSIDGSTKIFGILGRPVAHSLSPVMHNAAFRHLGMNAVYVAFPVTELRKAVAGVRGLGIGGVSVTIPFKEEIIPLIDALDPRAENRGGEHRGEPGRAPHRLQHRLAGGSGGADGQNQPYGAARAHPGGRGASRAIAYGIFHKGGKVSLTDIDQARAAALAREVGAEAISPAALESCPATVLVNATPVGMTPEVDGIPINPDLLGRFGVVMDIVYQPLTTRLLREAKARGAAAIDGLQMLIHQATAQFELFTGQAPRPRSWPRRRMRLWE